MPIYEFGFIIRFPPLRSLETRKLGWSIAFRGIQEYVNGRSGNEKGNAGQYMSLRSLLSSVFGRQADANSRVSRARTLLRKGDYLTGC